MLTGYDLAARGFLDPHGEGIHCRACTVKVLGEACVARMEIGLNARPLGWTAASRYMIDEEAVENGYEYHERGQMDHADPPHNAAGELMQSCEECGQVQCFTCGTRLDTTPEVRRAMPPEAQSPFHRSFLEWHPGRRAVDHTALMAEHANCTRCYDERKIVVRWDNGDAVWGPCPECAK